MQKQHQHQSHLKIWRQTNNDKTPTQAVQQKRTIRANVPLVIISSGDLEWKKGPEKVFLFVCLSNVVEVKEEKEERNKDGSVRGLLS